MTLQIKMAGDSPTIYLAPFLKLYSDRNRLAGFANAALID